MLMTTNNLE